MDELGKSCLGVRVWYNPTSTAPVADIVGVHGLAANPFWTWVSKAEKSDTRRLPQSTASAALPGSSRSGTSEVVIDAENSVMWLQKLLPSYVPQCRILTFGYDAKYIVKAPKRDISNCASELLSALMAFRSEAEVRRPIVFIAHSFGGIVVKEALVKATLASKLYGAIRLSTHGIIFLGTPHRGTNFAAYGEILVSMAKSLGLGSNTQVIRSLRSQSPELLKLAVNFTDIYDAFEIFCFYELLPWKFSSVVVDEQSATMEGRPSIGLTVNHSDMNKFGRVTDPNFVKVAEKVASMVDSALSRTPAGSFPPSSQDLPWEIASVITAEIDNVFDHIIKKYQSRRFEMALEEALVIQRYRMQSWAFGAGLTTILEKRRPLHENLATPSGVGVCNALNQILSELESARGFLNQEGDIQNFVHSITTVHSSLQHLFDLFSGNDQAMMRLALAHRLVRNVEHMDDLQVLLNGDPALPSPDLEAIATMKRIKMLMELSTVQRLGQEPLLIEFSDLKLDRSPSTSRSTGLYWLGEDDEPSCDILVEWKIYKGFWNSEIGDDLFTRVEMLTEFLKTASKASHIWDFRLLDCLGYCHDEQKARIGFVFSLPKSVSERRSLIRLNELMRTYKNSRLSPPAVGERFALAKTLCTAIFGLHVAEWFHKNFSSHNISLFADSDPESNPLSPAEKVATYSITTPYILGFEHSRPSKPHELSEPAMLSNEAYLYRHPNYVEVTMQKYRHEFDYYSLGVVLLEIGIWTPLSTIITESEMSNKDVVPSKIKYLCSLLDASVGVIYRHVVTSLLTCFSVNEDMVAQNELSSSGDLMGFQTDILESLGECKA